jgi:hypothetical protein
MVYSTLKNHVYGLCPSSNVFSPQKTQRFGNWVCFRLLLNRTILKWKACLLAVGISSLVTQCMISNDGFGWQMEHFLLLLGNISNLERIFVIPRIGCSGLDVFVFSQLCLYCGYVNDSSRRRIVSCSFKDLVLLAVGM